MLPFLEDQFDEIYADLGSPGAGDRWSYLGVVGPVWERFTTFLVFQGRTDPVLRVKIGRDDGGDQQLLRDEEMIRFLGSRGIRVAPDLLLSAEVEGRRLSVEAVPKGPPLVMRSGGDIASSARFAQAIERVTATLISLDLATEQSPHEPNQNFRQQAVRSLHRFRDLFALTGAAEAWVSELVEKLGSDAPWRGSFAHGDLRGNNVFSESSRLTITNWYLSSRLPPLHDFFTFLLCEHESEQPTDPQHLLDWINLTLLERTPYSEVTWRGLDRCCRTQELPLSTVWSCLGLFLANSALRQQDVALEAAGFGLRRRQSEDRWVMAFDQIARAVMPPHDGVDLSFSPIASSLPRGGTSYASANLAAAPGVER